jgi:hypothetical protein
MLSIGMAMAPLLAALPLFGTAHQLDATSNVG